MAGVTTPGSASGPIAVLRTGANWTVATEAVEVVEIHSSDAGTDAFAALDGLTPGFWAGFATFELGHAVERVRPGRASADPSPRLPDLCWVRFARQTTVDEWPTREAQGAGLGVAARSSLDHHEFGAGVERVLEHIRAGDCYQVNLTRTIEWDHEANAEVLFANLVATNAAPHASFVRVPTRHGSVAVVSASPERFVGWRGRSVETRPIKGTAAQAEVLERSAKDRAENVMIVDLARNDLGRVCATGSIHVPTLCEIELHPGLAHLVSTVRGELRPDVGLGDLLRATFPAASITGAPKPRVLQLIEDLEPVRRGVYCGAVGWIDTAKGCGDLAVAIRTFTVGHGRTTLGVGGGIVADSLPDREWEETELKAHRLLAAAGATDARSLHASV